MAEIFLSYDSQDRETAGKVADLLASAGWTVWWDRRIPAGRTWRSVLEEALTEMRCMVVLWSKHSIDSHWVKEEAEEARSLEKLVPVMIDLVKPPVGFRAIQAADLVGWNGSENTPGARQLIADLESLLGKPEHKQADAAAPVHATTPRPEEPVVTPPRNVEQHEAPAEVTSTHLSRADTTSSVSTWLNWKTGSGVAAVLALVIAVLSLWPREQNSEEPTLPAKVETPREAPQPVVAPTVIGLTITAPRKTLKTGESADLNVDVSYSDGGKSRLAKVDRWEVTPKKIVSIDDTGEIKALEPGTAKIVARYGNLASDPWTVSVEAPPAVKPPRAVVAEAPKRTVVEAARPKAPASAATHASAPPPPRAPVASMRTPESAPAYSNQVAPHESITPYVTRARTYRVQGNYAAALAELDRARAIDPASSEVRQEIAQTRKACEAEKSLGYNVSC